ncbi:ubiquitinconjugating enzyme subfamily protein [Pelomyxa schiedti]|nr:ubiquitinconjugating enzyme subfamily protein [Pelomyxa schiedti]
MSGGGGVGGDAGGSGGGTVNTTPPAVTAVVPPSPKRSHYNTPPPTGVPSQISEDEALARLLQEQEEESHRSSGTGGSGRGSGSLCPLCNTSKPFDDIYILDECSHRFCKACILRYVEDKLMTSVQYVCPLPSCNKQLSVRDMKDLMPKRAANARPTQSSKRASQRIMDELRYIMASNPEKNGYSAEVVDDNLYLWEIKFFNFDKTEPIARDMATMRVKHITMHVAFPSTYPMTPPFCRIIRPRFQFRTGHVTVGGSICMELLTNKGWSPENTIEAVCMSIRSSFLEGGARLDTHNRTDYTEREAKDAFDRLVREHGWF